MRISTRITLGIILVSATLVGIFGALSINETRRDLKSALHKQGSTIAQLIAASSIETMISEDYPALDVELETIGRGNGNIQLIEVSHDGKVVSRFNNPSPGPGMDLHADILLHNDAGTIKLGDVRLRVSEAENEAIIASRIKSLFVYSLIAFILLSLAMHLMMHKLVVRRLEKLKRLTEDVIAAELPSLAAPHPQKAQDEIDVLHERFVGMLDGLQSRDHARAVMLSEIAAARAELSELNDRLESQVDERTRELTRAMQAAESANKTKSAFLANMSHEIRTPINSILGMAYLALNSGDPSKTHSHLEKIRFSGLHLLELIDEILDFSKISAGKLKIDKVDFDLNEMLENTNALFEERVKEKGLDFTVNMAPDLPRHLRGDPLRLRQVLVNYISNAIKFTERGGITVSARRVDDTGSGVVVHFEVRDTGIGMDEAALSLLFQPFQQADMSTTREYGGTGLGLAICKQLVGMMAEGQVGVESAPGKGSTFWFRVRLAPGYPTHAAAHESAGDAAWPSGLAGADILVAEDHPLNQDVIVAILENAGADVTVVGNGKEVLEHLGRRRFDCILMDVQMPIMDGYETTRLIRANPAWADTPVIAMTANALVEDRERCLQAGMDDFISKPFTPSIFYATVAHWVGEPPRQPAPAGVPSGPAVAVAPLPASPRTERAEGSSAIDLTDLIAMLGGDKLKVHEFVHKFLSSSRAGMERIGAALAQKDLMEAGKQAHYIRSPASIVGAHDFSELGKMLEACCRTPGDVGQAREISRRMHAMLHRINEEIDSFVACQDAGMI